MLLWERDVITDRRARYLYTYRYTEADMKRTLLAISSLTLSLFGIFARSPDAKVSPAEARELLAAKPPAILIDVRTEGEFKGGRIPGALLLPFDEITRESATAIIPAKDSKVIVYCRSGRRSSIAAKTLRDLGYSNVRDLGAISDWPYGFER